MKCTALLLSSLALGVAGAAHADVIERVVAVVNGDAIFLSELRVRAAAFAPDAPLLSADEIELRYREVLEQMVDERLIRQAAEAMQLTLGRDEVDRAIAEVRTNAGLDEEELWQAVHAQGFTSDGYRALVRDQLLRLKVIRTRTGDRVAVSESDVRRGYESLRAAHRDRWVESYEQMRPSIVRELTHEAFVREEAALLLELRRHAVIEIRS